MLKAIHVKKQILGSEISEEISYLYKELSMTYYANDDFENAAKCTKKQLNIREELKQNDTMDFAQSQCFLGEMYRDMD